MPNLISVKRLAQFYRKSSKNIFCMLLVVYEVKNEKINYKECYFKPIEQFSWRCLTIGALGWGQIQIANANKLTFAKSNRKQWMIKMCDTLADFYDTEISKIGERKSWFQSEREYWSQQ